MPAISPERPNPSPVPPVHVRSPQDVTPIRVCVTGFGPFAHHMQNPSWLAVKPLHNTIIVPYVPDERGDEIHADAPLTRPIHITVLQVPVTYSAVLSIVPGLHANPPRLPGRGHVPDLDEDSVTPFDFILHVGVAGRGGLRVEKKGHKYGYDRPGSDGKLCLVAEGSSRGFAKGYEELDEELYTSVDIDAVVDHLNQMGHRGTYASDDAGYYLCDFIFYASLAESIKTDGKRVMFLHCPPVGEPLETREVTQAIREIVQYVCTKSE